MVEGFVAPVKLRNIAWVLWDEGVVTTMRNAFAVGALTVLPEPAMLSLASVGVPLEKPLGAVQVPDAVVQTWISICLILVVADVVQKKL